MLVRETDRFMEHRLHHTDLAAVGTNPKYQKQGAASMLVAWGCERADDNHLPTYVEATPIAQGVYTRHGFVKVDQLRMSLDKWKQGDFCNACMIRPAKP